MLYEFQLIKNLSDELNTVKIKNIKLTSQVASLQNEIRLLKNEITYYKICNNR